jgi:hypothetical protein
LCGTLTGGTVATGLPQSLEVHDQAAHDEEELADTSEKDITTFASGLKNMIASFLEGSFLSAGDHHSSHGASSASVAVIVLAAVVVLALLIGNFTDFEMCKSCLPKGMVRRSGFKTLEP